MINLKINWEVISLYKIQVFDALTHEMLREQTYETMEAVLGFIDYVEKGHECFLFDDELRLHKAEHITHYSHAEEDKEVYKVFLQLDLIEVEEAVPV